MNKSGGGRRRGLMASAWKTSAVVLSFPPSSRHNVSFLLCFPFHVILSPIFLFDGQMLLDEGGKHHYVHTHHCAHHHFILDQQKQGRASIRKRASSPTIHAVCHGLLGAAATAATGGSGGGKQALELRVEGRTTRTEKLHTVVRLGPQLLEKGLHHIGAGPSSLGGRQ